MSKRILIADDTAYMRSIIRETLEGAGLAIVGEAENGVSAFAMYRQQQPDLLILNLVMPEMSGLDTLKEIKAWDPHAKILICSAMTQPSTIFGTIKAGANDFLAKPFTSKRLIDSICKILNLKFIAPVE